MEMDDWGVRTGGGGRGMRIQVEFGFGGETGSGAAPVSGSVLAHSPLMPVDGRRGWVCNLG